MKAFILAAGDGTRLRPLTESVPKCLLPIQGVPLLEIWLNSCEAAGITDVLINAHAHAEAVKQFVATQKSGVRASIVEEPQLLGSAGTLAENRAFAGGEEAFFVLYGDVLTNVDLRRMLEFHRQKNLPATLGIYHVPDPTRCGIVTMDEHSVIQKFVEKPTHPESSWAFAGVMIAGQEIFDFVPDQRPADIGFGVLPKMAGRMTGYRISEYLIDIGTAENYQAAQRSWPGLARSQQTG
ncbi:MAG TPA: nucleotidyltransferase family protein [Candidatus Angelobacter sp.]|jgi:mannose-1-phosphate guanylyltransferase|nr:nucleotidyltransferase family protein [Candidatus Angelobacter sp.]